MNLREYPLPPWNPADDRAAGAPPEAVARFLADADRRIDTLFAGGSQRRLPRFIPADAGAVYAALDHITRKDLPVGRVFCEWGSGLGVATCIARMLGYEAYGIEIEDELTALARQLAADHRIDVSYLNISYLPEGFECYQGAGGTELVTPDMQARAGGDRTAIAPCHYQGMPCGTDEIDVFYVYPWPGEQEMMLELFDHLAADGAILLSCLGDGEIAAYQKLGAGW